MASDLFECPQCNAKLRRSPSLRVGGLVQCPKCQNRFPVPPEEERSASEEPPPAAPPPRPRPRDDDLELDREEDHEAWDERRGRRDFEPTATRRAEDQPAWSGGGEIDLPPRSRSRAEEDEDYPISRRDYGGEPSSDYVIDVGQWFTHAKQHYAAILGPAVGFLAICGAIWFALYLIQQAVVFAFIGAKGGFAAGGPPPGFNISPEELLLMQAIQVGASATCQILLQTPLLSGLTNVCLAQLKGDRWSFGDFFGGFRRFPAIASLALVSQLIGLPFPVSQLLGSYLQQRAFAAGQFGAGPIPEALLCQAFGYLWLLVYGVVWVKLMFFARELVFDRGYTAVEAMSASWKMSNGHFWALLGIGLLLGLINTGGFFACCIGLLFSVPFVALTFTSGYLLSGGTCPPVSLGYDEDHGYRPRSRGRYSDYRDDRDPDRDQDRYRRDDY